nr:hypothetical protein [Tanacetum cinerariifolium]
MKKVKPSSRSKAIKDIITIGSFVEALVLNHYVLVRKILGIEMEQDNIQERSVLSIDCHRPFIQVTAVSIEFLESSMPMRQTRLKRIKMINSDAWVKDSIFIPKWVKIRRNNGIREISKKDPHNICQKRGVIILNCIPKQTDSLKTKDFNKHLLTSTGVKPITIASESKPSSNTKNNRITRPPSSNQKNKVEDHSRKVKSSLNKMNSFSEPVSRSFTIVRNRFHLTRITSTKVVPTKKISTRSVATPTQGILVYSRRLEATISVGSDRKVNILESKTANSKEPKQSWGSTISNVPSSSLNDCRLSKLFFVRFGNDHIAKIIGYEDYQMGNVTISRVYYVE